MPASGRVFLPTGDAIALRVVGTRTPGTVRMFRDDAAQGRYPSPPVRPRPPIERDPAMIRASCLPALVVLALFAIPALASSFAGSSAGSSAAGSSASSGSTSGDDKVVVQARDDAARFVATDGAIRGARLEAALRHLRETREDAQGADDLQLARAILAL